uniref:Uncharacterized protein n=1 Tax=Panagrolaimus davidi TaxID=227884 RepID=A0A914PCJ4_9BILA
MADSEHFYLEELVENFTKSNNDVVKELIKKMFIHDGVEAFMEDKKLKITGYKIATSDAIKAVEVHKSPTCAEVEICAKHEIIFDKDLLLLGMNLSLITINLSIPKKAFIDLSGVNVNNECHPKKAKDGENPGENGDDGNDGNAGQSSGNLCILVQNVDNINNLEVILNGGKGGDGQDGGNGADGEDGKTADPEKVFNTAHKVNFVVKSFANFTTRGTYSNIGEKEEEGENEDGIKFYKNTSYLNGTTHCIRLYKGGKAKSEVGKGGKNGLGGKGGFKGDYFVSINGTVFNDTFEVEAQDGENGKKGSVGKNGKPGTDGWDIAEIKNNILHEKQYGVKQKEKLYLEFSDEFSDESVYIRNRDTDEYEHKCYVRVIPEEPKQVILSDRNCEEELAKNEEERSNESLARKSNPIDIEVAKEQFQMLTQTGFNVSTDVESEVEQEEIVEIHRLYEAYGITLNDHYKPLLKANDDFLTPESVLGK